MKNIACFDIGGTFIKYAVISENGQMLTQGKFSTPRNNAEKDIPDALVEKINELKEEYHIHSVGISSCGLIDSEKGEVILSANIPEYTGANPVKRIKEKLGLEASIENDVRCAGLGEMWQGAAKGRDNFILITLGTGIGGAIVINGRLLKGVHNLAGEIGHIITHSGGEVCGCGAVGCYERYASTSAFVRMYEERLVKAGINADGVNGEEIMKRVYAGEKLAKDVYDEFLNNIVDGLVSITHLYDPGLIIVGGGISAQGEPFFDRINKLFSKSVMSVYADHTKIVPAQLGNNAGVYGACYCALRK